MRRGATLVEILVVTAILAVLMALLFPVFQAAKISAFDAQENSQLRQLAVGHGIYLNDNDDVEFASSVPLITGRYVPPEIVRSPLDPFPEGWANSLVTPIDKDPRTSWKDSFVPLRMVTGEWLFPRFVDSMNGGWLVSAGRELARYREQVIFKPVMYKRLTFSGGIVRRPMPVKGYGTDRVSNSMDLMFSDEDITGSIKPR